MHHPQRHGTLAQTCIQMHRLEQDVSAACFTGSERYTCLQIRKVAYSRLHLSNTIEHVEGVA